jgi:osmotically-inducible protein OsmY
VSSKTPMTRLVRTTAAAALLGAALAGCAPLLLGGAVVGGGLVVTDRRTTGIQLEDEGIERRAAGHISVTSYNRVLLITGEVPTEADKLAIGEALAKGENVKSVVNELGIGPNSSPGSRTTDAFLTTKVKATLVDAKDVQANAYKVVVERAVVFLMGRVTEREANRGAELARSVSSVQKVVRVFEILSEEELANLGRSSTPAAAASGAAK